MFIWLRAEPLLKRVLDLAEKRAEAPPAIESDPIPADMLAAALAYPEAWAREQAVSRLREIRNDTGSWDQARNVWLREIEV